MSEKKATSKYLDLRRRIWQCWRIQHNDELHNLYSSLDINKMIRSKRSRSVGYVTKQYVQNFACQHHGNRPLGKLYVDERLTCIQRILCININIYMGWESADWILPDKERAKDGALSKGNKLVDSKRRGTEYLSDYLVPVTLPQGISCIGVPLSVDNFSLLSAEEIPRWF